MQVEARKRLSALLGSSLALSLSGVAMAQQAPEKPYLLGEQPPPARDWVDQVKNPADWLKWGADLRLRHEHLYNPFLVDADPPGNEWGFERLRTRLWSTVTPVKNLDVNARLTWEGRHWWLPDTRDEWDESEVVWDNLNVKMKFQDWNTTVTVGRQDIIFGDGWLVLEGTPLDGSRTIYFDAARFTIDLKQCKTAVDLIYIQQYSDTDTWLPPIFSKDVSLMEQDERGAILYMTNKSIEQTQIDAYFIYKHDNAALPKGDDGDVYTLGSRVAHDFNANWKGRIEGAYQFGQRNNLDVFPGSDGDLSAWGLNSQLAYHFNDPWKNRLRVGYEYLSGDDPGSSNNEQFDPLWGRWPQWSELLVYTNVIEDRVAEMSNIHRINLGWSADPTKKMQLSADYHALFRDENIHAGAPGFSGSGEFKGHLFTAVMRYKFNRFLSGHVMGEYFLPGNYYEEIDGTPLETREDDAAYLRAELVFTF